MANMSITGHLGRDAETHSSQRNGNSFITFSIPNEIGWGEDKETQWVKCIMFGKRAESVVDYLTKGTLVEVHGIPKVETWDGQKGFGAAISIVVSELKLHGGTKGRDDIRRPQERQTRPRGRQLPPENDYDMDDEIPF